MKTARGSDVPPGFESLALRSNLCRRPHELLRRMPRYFAGVVRLSPAQSHRRQAFGGASGGRAASGKAASSACSTALLQRGCACAGGRRGAPSFGTAPDGRIFNAPRGGYLSEALYGRIWKDARAKVLTAAQVASPLAGRPYDLRHAGVSLWLNGGVPAPEVARRAGHGVGVLLRVYAGCIDGEERLVNTRIEDALRASRERGRPEGKSRHDDLCPPAPGGFSASPARQDV